MLEFELDLQETMFEDIVEIDLGKVVKIQHMVELFLGLSMQVP